MIKVYMEYERLLEGLFGIHTGPISSFQTLKRSLSPHVEFVKDITSCDLIHVHEIISPSALAAMGKFKPYVIHAHLLPGDLDQKTVVASIVRKFVWAYLMGLYKNAIKVIAVSAHGRDELVRFGVPPEKITIIGNGIEVGHFRPDPKKRAAMREKLCLGESDTVVYSVGNVLKRKGVDDFIRLAAANPSLKFVWFGGFAPSFYTGHSRESVQRKIEKLKNIQFPGFIDDITMAHSCGDIFCFPSLFEAQGIVVAEAAAAKRPLVLRDIPSYKPFGSGSCLKANNLGEFSAHLRRLANSPEFGKKIAERAYKVVKKEYGSKIVAKKVLAVYHEVAGC